MPEAIKGAAGTEHYSVEPERATRLMFDCDRWGKQVPDPENIC